MHYRPRSDVPCTISYQNGKSGCVLRKFFAPLAVYDTRVKGADANIYVDDVGKVEGFAGEIMRAVKETENKKSIPKPEQLDGQIGMKYFQMWRWNVSEFSFH